MGNNPLQIVQFTDTHLYDTEDGALLGINTQQSFAAVVALARRRHWPADLVLATGDLTHDGGEPAFTRIRQQLAELGPPVYCLPGNHDENALLSAHLNSDGVQSVKHFTRDGWLVCMLNSTVPGSEGGHLDRQELHYLEQQLAAHPRHQALVCLHHQPVPVGSRWLDTMAVDNAADFFAVIDRFPQVRGVVWGHIHQRFDAIRNGIQLMGSPSTCIQFGPGSEEFALDDATPGYRWLQLFADGRIATGIERLDTMPGTLDRASSGY